MQNYVDARRLKSKYQIRMIQVSRWDSEYICFYLSQFVYCHFETLIFQPKYSFLSSNSDKRKLNFIFRPIYTSVSSEKIQLQIALFHFQHPKFVVNWAFQIVFRSYHLGFTEDIVQANFGSFSTFIHYVPSFVSEELTNCKVFKCLIYHIKLDHMTQSAICIPVAKMPSFSAKKCQEEQRSALRFP